MPIKACADKLAYEMETYGVPPKFPLFEAMEGKADDEERDGPKDKAKGKKV